MERERRMANRNNCEQEDKLSLSLLIQCGLLFAWIMCSVPAVLWGLLIPYHKMRYGYVKDKLLVEKIETGKGSTHTTPYAIGTIVGMSKRAVVGLWPADEINIQLGDKIDVQVCAKASKLDMTEVTWVMGRSLLCMKELDMQNSVMYALLAWGIYWPSLFVFLWLGFCKKRGILARIIE